MKTKKQTEKKIIHTEHGDVAVFGIEKKNKSIRHIYAPQGDYKINLQEIAYSLDKKVSNLKSEEIAAFTSGRNCAWAALRIAQQEPKFLLTMDLSNFFDSITKDQVQTHVGHKIAEKTTIDGFTKQGMPSSPAISNIVGHKLLDIPIKRWLEKNMPDVSFIRYADDFAFTLQSYEQFETIKKTVTNIATKSGFKINQKKTRLQDARRGNFNWLGIAINPKTGEIATTKRTRKKIRAIEHTINTIHESIKNPQALENLPKKTKKLIKQQKNKTKNKTKNAIYLLNCKRLSGFINWAQCHLPKEHKTQRKTFPQDLLKVMRTLAVPKNIKFTNETKERFSQWNKKTDIKFENLTITQDPILLLSAATLTPKRTCYTWANGPIHKGASKNRNSTLTLMETKNVWIAYIKGDKTYKLTPTVEKPQILARAYLFAKIDNPTKPSDFNYAKNEIYDYTGKNILESALNKAGIMPADTQKIIGKTNKNHHPTKYLSGMSLTNNMEIKTH